MMPPRLLAYDPSPEGRRLLRQALVGFNLSLRSSLTSCLQALSQGKWQACVLGWPLPAKESASLLSAIQRLSPPPLLLFFGEDLQPRDGFPRTMAGAQALAEVLLFSCRAHDITCLASGLRIGAVDLSRKDMRSQVAEAVCAGLEKIGLCGLMAFPGEHSGDWLVMPPRPECPVPVERLAAMLADLRATRRRNREPRYETITLEQESPGGEGAEASSRLAQQVGVMRVIGQDGALLAALMVFEPLALEERQALEVLASRLAELLEEARAVDYQARRARALGALLQASLILHDAAEPEELAQRALDLLPLVVPFDSAYLLVEGSSGQCIYTRGSSSQPDGATGKQQALQWETMPAFRRMRKTGQPVLVNDASRVKESSVPAGQAKVCSWVAVPVECEGEVIGLIAVASVSPAFYQDVDVEMVTAFARQFGLALENARRLRLERRAAKQGRLLQQAAAVLTSTSEVGPSLEGLARAAAEALGVSRAGVILFSPQLDRLTVAAVYDPQRTLPPEAERWWRGSIPAMALPRDWNEHFIRQPRVLAGEELAALGERGRQLGLKSVLMAPICREGRILGVLAADEPKAEKDFTPEDLVLASTLADHAAMAIDNAQAIGELRHRSAELTALYHLGIALSQEITPEGVVDLLLDQVNRLIDVDSVVVARLQSPDALHCEVLDAGRRLPALTVSLSGPTLSGHVIRTGEPLLINDYDSEAASLPVPGLAAGIPVRSWLGVPLVARGEVIGAVSVQAETPFRFRAEHLRLLQMVANHTAIALDNARLLQTARHRAEQLRLVNEIGRYAVSVLDVQQLARELAMRIQKAFGYYAVQLMLVEDGRLVPRAAVRAPGGDLVELRRSLSLQQPTIMTTVANTGRPWLVPEVDKEPRYLAAAEFPLTRCELAVPLTIASDVVGVLDVQSDRAHGLTASDTELLQILAAQVAISFANARLFSEVRAHAAQLEARVAARTAEIRSEKERTEAILRSVADAVVVLDLHGRVILANPIAETLLASEHSSDIVMQIQRLHKEGGVVSEQLEVGSLTFQALASPVTQGDLAVGTVVVLRDITRLRELDRLKSQFVATVSHELRTPLANLKLYLSLLRQGRPERREQYLQTLEQETARLGEMIEDLLDLSRLESGTEIMEREGLLLAELARQVVENHRPAFQERPLDLRFTAEGSPMVIANRGELIRVLTNLLSNALRYTPPGGWVRVGVQGPEIVGGRSMARLTVQDSGPGIPEDELPFLFDRFYRGSLARSSNTPGSGLGLAIVREIVDRHGGEVQVTSRLGHGSLFTVLLPCQGEPER